MSFPLIEIDRLQLIGLTEDHINDLFEQYSDEEAMKYWDGFPHKDHQETVKLVQRLDERYKTGNSIWWGIKFKGTHKIIGSLGYNRFAPNGLAVIGYMLNRKYWQQGIMTEAVTGMVKFGFEELKVHRIEAHVTPGNTVSERLLLKLGFMREGLLREREFYKGTHQSLIIYGKLESDK